MSKSSIRKITADPTKCNTDSRRPSVFERLGTKPAIAAAAAAQSTSDYCRNWALNGSCSYGKSCKWVSTFPPAATKFTGGIRQATIHTKTRYLYTEKVFMFSSYKMKSSDGEKSDEIWLSYPKWKKIIACISCYTISDSFVYIPNKIHTIGFNN